jgi:hypothetical protein
MHLSSAHGADDDRGRKNATLVVYAVARSFRDRWAQAPTRAER